MTMGHDLGARTPLEGHLRNQVMRYAKVSACLLLAGGPALCAAETLAEVLTRQGVSVIPGGPSRLNRQITGQDLQDDEVFVIAYDEVAADPSAPLPDRIHVSVRERATGTWRHAEVPRELSLGGSSRRAGSISRIHRAADYFYLDTHVNPSAGTLVVLSRTLEPVAALNGWFATPLRDGTVVYHRSMVHFAPTHPEELWVYDARSREDVRLYPNAPYGAVRQAYIDDVRRIYARVGDDWFRINNHHGDPERFDSSIGREYATDANGNSIAFVATFGADGGDSPAATPKLEVLVACLDVAARRCSEESLSAARARRPGWSDRQLLEEVVRAR